MRLGDPLLWSLALIAMLAAHRSAFAYLDPGTGSILLQALLGGVAGGLVILRLYWTRVKEFFGHGPRKRPAGEGSAQGDDESLSA